MKDATSCSAPGCKSNYKTDRITLFKMPPSSEKLGFGGGSLLLREHFREEDVEYIHRVPIGDDTFREIPHVSPKLKYDTLPVFLLGSPSY